MMRFLPILVLSFACSGVAIKDGSEKVREGTYSGNNQVTTDKDEAAATPEQETVIAPENAKIPTAVTDPSVVEDESITIPQKISGTYLTCVTSTVSTDTNATVQCALRDQTTAANVNLSTSYVSHSWAMSPKVGITSTMRTLASTDEYQAEFAVSSPTGGLRNQTLLFNLSVVDQNNVAQGMQAPINLHYIRWQPVDGRIIPVEAVMVGTSSSLTEPEYLCRIKYKGRYFYGRSQRSNYALNSTCKAISHEATVLDSHDASGLTLTNQFDVLVMEKGYDHTEVLEWRMSNQVDPNLAFFANYNPNGSKTIPCRTETPSNPVFDRTPGMVDNSLPHWCDYDAGGVFGTETFSVLQWKNAEAKASYEATLTR